MLHALEGFTQVALAVIAFNIGSQLVFSRLKEIGRSIVLLATAQLLAPFFVVLAAESVMGLAFPTALVLAAVAPATAPTTTYSVIRRLNASGPFVDRVLGVLALNDAAAVLIFSVASAAALTLVSADGSAATLTSALVTATTNELVSVVTGLALGVAYLGGRKLIEDGTPGWQARLTAMLLGLLVASIGSAVALGLSHLLVPLSLGAVIANGIDDAERGFLHELIRSFEEPLFIVFFVLAGAHLPLSAAAHAAILAATAVYLAGRFGGKYAGIFATATTLKLDQPTRRYLGLCFPSQGALAMGLVLAFRSSPAVSACHRQRCSRLKPRSRSSWSRC
ncbi:MAG: cation:proton antiporter [Defluviicoccus sp.]|nr:MAG: cation:proton antiporter [Defluviicoccus sp.]